FMYWLAAAVNPKAKAFLKGRREQKKKLRSTFPLEAPVRLVWFHCASLGEFEQGRPVIEALKQWNPTIKVLLTFFSPSGYEVRKNYESADFVFYLPWDTRTNARWFAENIRPSLAVFVKYEFWYHYSTELHKNNVPLISISSIFRPEQPFFRPYGALFRSILKSFEHFFVQNQVSRDLLHSIGINRVTIAGDTRFDRVNQIIQQAAEIPIASKFKNGQKLMVIGSAWPEDVDVLLPFINENKDRLKFIIAPHEISEDFIQEIEKGIDARTIRYSKGEGAALEESAVMIVDNVGMLSRLYGYGEFAFVGGAYGAGLHNILEAACYGIPIFFGNKSYSKYQEAVDLVLRGGAFDVANFVELKAKYEMMMMHPEQFLLACEVTSQYVKENLGASEKITGYCKKFLS
ncbi:MAG TPA: glycosyltransferase N-terminal domain-containing protein, partial [Cyclobacteriaceae bacterium]|nr:glycosyltransferase N-terminal domain-containing protein [Cyclobacteriaceae bacterium]